MEPSVKRFDELKPLFGLTSVIYNVKLKFTYNGDTYYAESDSVCKGDLV